MPILNIQVKVENNKIVYKWFRKEMSNYLLLLANSAMPQRTKRECLVQYAMTILLNTSRQLPWEVAADTLSVRWPGLRAEVLPCTGPETTSQRRGGRRS